MNDRQEYQPSPARGAKIRMNVVPKDQIQKAQVREDHVQKKEEEKWTLILVRELRHSPEKVWQALTDPLQLREWAPFDADGSLGAVGTVKLTWVGAPTPLETRVTRADPPKTLEYDDTRWELEAVEGGTRLTLWHNIDRRFISWGAAGWHISFDVLDQLLAGQPIGRISGPDTRNSAEWKRLVAEYARQFGLETHNSPA